MDTLAGHLQAAQKLYAALSSDAAFAAAYKKTSDAIAETFKRGGKLLIAGNGGSAAQAQHFAAEIVGRYKTERRGLPALALTTDTSALTAIGNDYSFDDIFSRQVEALGRKGDVFVGLSTSGNSKNVLRAVETAKARGIRTICLLGRGGGLLKDAADIPLVVPSDDTARVQEVHLLVIHALSDAVDAAFAG